MISDFQMPPIAWFFVSLFAGVILIIALVYLFTLKLQRDKKKAARSAENDEIFGSVMANPIT